MRILHYFLGFPPYRTGGLTKCSYDIMTSQKNQGDIVFALWPGKMNLFNKKVKIIYRGMFDGIESYELINPLPVPLDEGVKDVDLFMEKCDSAIYEKFLKKLRPDVIHIHTLMGLHKEFILVANKKKVKTVFTSHDYYGICPKVTLYHNKGVCDNKDCKDCVYCNLNALSIKQIMLIQSPLYRVLKDSAIIKKLRKQHRNEFFSEDDQPEILMSDVDMLQNIDLIHFNSTVAESVYCRYLKPKNSVVLSISHKDISDKRDTPHKGDSILRLTCLAPAKPFKGFNIMKQALDELWEEGKRDFILNIFNQVPQLSPYMRISTGQFDYSLLKSIMEESDVLLAPSVWYETFGYTVLEALSFGVPVVVTDHVGAKDIVGDGGVVIPSGSVEALKRTIKSLTPSYLEKLRENIRNNIKIKTWEMFLKEIKDIYKS